MCYYFLGLYIERCYQHFYIFDSIAGDYKRRQSWKWGTRGLVSRIIWAFPKVCPFTSVWAVSTLFGQFAPFLCVNWQFSAIYSLIKQCVYFHYELKSVERENLKTIRGSSPNYDLSGHTILNHTDNSVAVLLVKLEQRNFSKKTFYER
jgi:hypothetical protein